MNNKHMLLGLHPYDWHQGHAPPAPWTAEHAPGSSIHLVGRPQLPGRIGGLYVDARDADHWALDDLRFGNYSMAASSASMPLSQFATRSGFLEQLADVGELPMAEVGHPAADGSRAVGPDDPIRPLCDLGVAPIGLEIGIRATNISAQPRQLRAALLLTIRDDMPERVPGSSELLHPGELVAPCEQCGTREDLYVVGENIVWCRGCGSTRVAGQTRVPTVLRALRGAVQ
jgi:hypothetical protein